MTLASGGMPRLARNAPNSPGGKLAAAKTSVLDAVGRAVICWGLQPNSPDCSSAACVELVKTTGRGAVDPRFKPAVVAVTGAVMAQELVVDHLFGQVARKSKTTGCGPDGL